MKTCVKCGQAFPATLDNFYKHSSQPDGLTSKCKACYQADRKTRGSSPKKTRKASATTVKTDSGYVASRDLLALWAAIRKPVDRGDHPANLMFLGPSGSGKTAGAEYLASIAGLDFTKVDATSMTDPESWFGTREVVARDGVPVTTYRPSVFVEAIQRPGVLLIDEANRVRDEHRQILLPLLDGTHQVTNPLTGETIHKHPGCFVIMSGNRGLQFTGTYAVDPALMTRSLVIEFDYMEATAESELAVERTGVDKSIADVFVRFASEARQRAKEDPDIAPISTREVLAACQLVADGLTVDLAAQFAIITSASEEGGLESVRSSLLKIWTGIRPTGRQ